MAFKDGMYAISKVLKAVAIAAAVACVGAGLYVCAYEHGGFGFLLGSLVAGTVAFLFFWTPAWVIKKFVQ